MKEAVRKTLRECNCLVEENFVIPSIREKMLRAVCLYWAEGMIGPWL